MSFLSFSNGVSNHCSILLIVYMVFMYFLRCLAVSPNFEIAKNNMAIALTDLGTKVVTISWLFLILPFLFFQLFYLYNLFRSNWRETLTKVWHITKELCIIIGIMRMPCTILVLLMEKC